MADEAGVASARVVNRPAAMDGPAVGEGAAVGEADAATDPTDDADEAAEWATDVASGDGGLVEVVLAGESTVVPLVARGKRRGALGGGRDRPGRRRGGPRRRRRGPRLGRPRDPPPASLVARRSPDRPAAVPDLPETAVAELSERQRQVVEAAYHDCYFSWCRESTGEQVAAAVDVSAPTFYDRLRKARDKLLGATVGRDGK